jgi:hypothetical protein
MNHVHDVHNVHRRAASLGHSPAVEAAAFRRRIPLNAAQTPAVMVNHETVLLAEGTRVPTVSMVYGFWVEDVGSADPEFLGSRVNGADQLI